MRWTLLTAFSPEDLHRERNASWMKFLCGDSARSWHVKMTLTNLFRERSFTSQNWKYSPARPKVKQSTAKYNTRSYKSSVLCCTLLYFAVLCCTLLYFAVLCCTFGRADIALPLGSNSLFAIATGNVCSLPVSKDCAQTSNDPIYL